MNPHQNPITVRQAHVQDADTVGPLFDAYRQFYGRAADAALATEFIRARLSHGESIVFLACSVDGQGVGFCQLYPSFCSVMAQRVGVLHDLVVSPALRQGGTGRALMRAAEHYAQTMGWARMDLTTAKANTQAQALCASQGWARDEVFYAYNKVTDR